MARRNRLELKMTVLVGARFRKGTCSKSLENNFGTCDRCTGGAIDNLTYHLACLDCLFRLSPREKGNDKAETEKSQHSHQFCLGEGMHSSEFDWQT
jgi:Holliday junction resolvasome RuvABC ATP-dependent DNA helicase subunit